MRTKGAYERSSSITDSVLLRPEGNRLFFCSSVSPKARDPEQNKRPGSWLLSMCLKRPLKTESSSFSEAQTLGWQRKKAAAATRRCSLDLCLCPGALASWPLRPACPGRLVTGLPAVLLQWEAPVRDGGAGRGRSQSISSHSLLQLLPRLRATLYHFFVAFAPGPCRPNGGKHLLGLPTPGWFISSFS